jgi:hypothetical protein
MKIRISRTIFFAVLALALFLVSYFATKGSYFARVTSVGFGATTAIFVGYVIELISYYRKTKKREAE